MPFALLVALEYTMSMMDAGKVCFEGLESPCVSQARPAVHRLLLILAPLRFLHFDAWVLHLPDTCTKEVNLNPVVRSFLERTISFRVLFLRSRTIDLTHSKLRGTGQKPSLPFNR